MPDKLRRQLSWQALLWIKHGHYSPTKNGDPKASPTAHDCVQLQHRDIIELFAYAPIANTGTEQDAPRVAQHISQAIPTTG
jgi:hypothetical protein